MNVLYLHGLDGSLSTEKAETLNFYAKKLIAPQINYRTDDLDALISNIFKNEEIGLVVGNSLGGYVAYHIACQYNIHCLLFNPALKIRTVNPKFSTSTAYGSYSSLMQVVLGGRDRVVSAASTISFLTAKDNASNIIFSYYPTLEHRIDDYVFSEELSRIWALI
jgi:uncharacterized protein